MTSETPVRRRIRDDADEMHAPAVRPTGRGLLHAVCAPLALVASAWLVTRATGGLQLAMTVYGTTMVAMFTVSAVYHRGTWSPAARRAWRRADHFAIFIFIAGSYTAFATLLMSDPGRAAYLAGLWIGALGCCVLKGTRMDRRGDIADVSYLVLGWSGLLVLPGLAGALPSVVTALLLGGGALFTIGGVVLTLRRPDPWPRVFGYHEVAHVLVAGGTSAHFVAYAMLLR